MFICHDDLAQLTLFPFPGIRMIAVIHKRRITVFLPDRAWSHPTDREKAQQTQLEELLMAIYDAYGIETSEQIENLSDTDFKRLADAIQSARMTAALLPLRRHPA